MRDMKRDWVLESDICAPDSHSGNQLYLFIAQFDGIKSGIRIDGNKIYDPNKVESGKEFTDIEADTWYHVKIRAYPYINKYDVILDGEVIAEKVEGNIRDSYQLWISPGNRGNSAGIYIAQYDNMSFYTIPSEMPAPAITGHGVWRTNASTAMVKFHTDQEGTYYYKVTDSAEAPSADYVKENKDGSAATTAGTVKVENVAGLSSGPKYVHIVVDNGELSNVHTIALPYDIYYYEDFESYDEGTYVAGSGSPLSPITQQSDGLGSALQKVTTISGETGKVLQLYGNGPSTWASDQKIALPSVPQNSFYVYEGRFNIDEAGSSDGVRFAFMQNGGSGPGRDTGLMVQNNHVYKHIDDKTYEFGTTQNDTWYTVKIVASPSLRTYDLYIDDNCYKSIPASSSLDYLWLSAYWESKAYFDDLKFYVLAPVTITFDTGKEGVTVESQTIAVGYAATIPTAPEAEGYTFKGWMLDGESYDFDTPVTGDITLTADWELITGEVTVTAPSASKTYDGTALTCDGFGDVKVVVTGLPDGFSYEAVVTGSRIDAGQSENEITSFVIKDASDVDVTSLYEGKITFTTGTLTVIPAELTISSGSASKTYDGTPLTSSAVQTQGLVGDETFTVTATGTITDAGTVPNAFIVEWDGTAKKDNYNLTQHIGTLTVNKADYEDLTETITVADNKVTTGVILNLPDLPDEAVYAVEGMVGGDNPEVISGTPSVSNGILTFDTTAQAVGKSAQITIAVTGAKNYNDFSLVVTVSVAASEGLYVKFENDEDVFTYTGDKITPLMEVYNNGNPLTPGKDYTVVYSGNINVTYEKATGKVVAGAKVTIKGKGNLADSKVLPFIIMPRSIGTEDGVPAQDVSVGTINIAVGQKATAPVITYGSYKLTTKDFQITDAMNGKAYTKDGDYTYRVEGKGNFTGLVEIPVHVIPEKKNLKKFTVVVDTKPDIIFDPFATEESVQGVLASHIRVYDSADKKKETPLVKGESYLITYPSDVLNAGKKKITIIGTGLYSGSAAKTITIKPLVVKGTSGNGTIDCNQDVVSEKEYHFAAGGVTVGENLELYYKNADVSQTKKLTEGTDYKVAYSNNKAVSKAGKPAEYAISFIGNYKGTPAIKNSKTSKINVFMILPSIIADAAGNPKDGFEVYTPDMAYTGKPGTYFSAPIVTLNGSALAASNYTVKYYLKSGDEYTEITSKNKLSLAEGVDEAEVQVRITAKGSVAGKGNYSGTINDTYKVIRKKTDEVYDLSKARITIYGKYDEVTGKYKKFAGVPYSGNPRKVTDIDPTDEKAYGKVVVEYKIGKTYVTLEENKDYRITYRNNVNKGKAIIYINGTNNKAEGVERAFVGSKKTTFSITAFNLKKLLSTLGG